MDDGWKREMADAFREIYAACDRITASLGRSIAICDQLIGAIQQMQREAKDGGSPPVGFV